ncbi:alpha/beta hydrolase family protein [Steroidobacter sp.]|uniref:alpha/beta hydrolase family protein n=1 Tax=Steroidobacter sp. TaxID=1978227 RepID=UPI001A50FF05|nr:hypothetical protein [Steroidobacter sp.]MBL8270284.1 hypothetical protein [Steroidobacter sp.]
MTSFHASSLCGFVIISIGMMVLPRPVHAEARAPATLRIPEQIFAGEPRGRYETGTFEELWINTALADPSTADPTDKRKVMVQVWYPAAVPRNAKRAPYVLNPQLYSKDHWLHQVEHVRTQSFLNAPLTASDEAFPILIYNHGNGQPHFSGTFQTEFLASQGYVVVAIGHPGSSGIERFPDGTTYENDGLKWNAERPQTSNSRDEPFGREGVEYGFTHSDLSLFVKDISFVLDRLTQLATDPKSRFYRRIDLQRVGAWGWSLGGLQALQAARDDERVRAAANLDGWPHGLAGPQGVVTLGSERPVMLMFNPANGGPRVPGPPGGEVSVGEVESSYAASTYFWTLLRRTAADWYHVTVARTNHGSFSDLPLFEPVAPKNLHPRAAHAIVNAYTLAFFDRYVRGDVASTSLLSGDGAYPEVTLLRRKTAE